MRLDCAAPLKTLLLDFFVQKHYQDWLSIKRWLLIRSVDVFLSLDLSLESCDRYYPGLVFAFVWCPTHDSHSACNPPCDLYRSLTTIMDMSRLRSIMLMYKQFPWIRLWCSWIDLYLLELSLRNIAALMIVLFEGFSYIPV